MMAFVMQVEFDMCLNLQSFSEEKRVNKVDFDAVHKHVNALKFQILTATSISLSKHSQLQYER